MFGQNTTCTNYYHCADPDCGECRPVVIGAIAHPLVQVGLVAAAAFALTRPLPRFVPTVVVIAWLASAAVAGLLYYRWVMSWP